MGCSALLVQIGGEEYTGQMLPHKAALMLVPLLSAFLGTLVSFRYRAMDEEFHEALKRAGDEGLDARQRLLLGLVSKGLLGAVVFFALALVPFLLFGVASGARVHWSWPLLCGAHFIMSTALFTTALIDLRTHVTRPWARYAILVLGLTGMIGAPVAAITLNGALMIA